MGGEVGREWMPVGDGEMSRKMLFVLRGTPGLGRVVAAVELARALEESFRVECFFVTYANGRLYLEALNTQCVVQIDRQDVMSLGIQPVSVSAERILEFVKKSHIDGVVVDGEPLMALALKVGLPDVAVISMMNPSDYWNAHLPASTVGFFRFCYGQADYRLIHGLESVTPREGNVLSTSTIIRREVLALSSSGRASVVSVVFGGGTASATSAFYESCRLFFKVVLDAARQETSLLFRVFLSEAEFPCQDGDIPTNVVIVKDIAAARDVYDCEIVVARAGRNTISEILFLKKKAVLFSVIGEHRTAEQQRNASLAQEWGRQSVRMLTSYDSTLLCAEIKKLQRTGTPDYEFSPGNTEALRFIAEKMRL